MVPVYLPTAVEIATAVENVVGASAGTVTFAPNDEVNGVAAWPHQMCYARATAAGLLGDESVESIVRDYITSDV